MSKEPLQPQDKYVLRMPDGMRDRIKKAAEVNKRSMNAEIVATLEEKYPSPLRPFDVDVFFAEYINPIVNENDGAERQELVKAANARLRKFHSKLEVWVTGKGDVSFGFRRPRSVSVAELEKAQNFFGSTEVAELDQNGNSNDQPSRPSKEVE